MFAGMDAAKFLAGNEAHHAGTRAIELGEIVVVSGRLAFHDPFESRGESAVLNVAPGRYRIWATEVQEDTGDPERPGAYDPAYLSIQLTSAEPDWVAPADELGEDVPSFGLWTGTDSGTIGAFDGAALAVDELTSRSTEFDRVLDDEANPHRFTYANIPLSESNEANIVISKSGRGDGAFPILATYDIDGRAVAIHVDFGMVDTEGADTAAVQKPKRSLRAALRRIFK